MTLTATVLDTPDPLGLARFHATLLDRPIGTQDPEWATLRPGGPGPSSQLSPTTCRRSGRRARTTPGCRRTWTSRSRT